jgi:hypothetical protein
MSRKPTTPYLHPFSPFYKASAANYPKLEAEIPSGKRSSKGFGSRRIPSDYADPAALHDRLARQQAKIQYYDDKISTIQDQLPTKLARATQKIEQSAANKIRRLQDAKDRALVPRSMIDYGPIRAQRALSRQQYRERVARSRAAKAAKAAASARDRAARSRASEAAKAAKAASHVHKLTKLEAAILRIDGQLSARAGSWATPSQLSALRGNSSGKSPMLQVD